MRVAIECAGFTPGEADMLRKSMATFKFTGGVSHFRDKLIAGMVANGYEQAFAEQTFKQRSEEHTSELQSLMRISYAVFCLKTTKPTTQRMMHVVHATPTTIHLVLMPAN